MGCRVEARTKAMLSGCMWLNLTFLSSHSCPTTIQMRVTVTVKILTMGGDEGEDEDEIDELDEDTDVEEEDKDMLDLTDIHLNLIFDFGGTGYCLFCLAQDAHCQVYVTGGHRASIRKEMVSHCSIQHRGKCEKFLQFDVDTLREMELRLKGKKQ
ncbi:hypothetical protein AX15_003285 [Amanita polypyramis BW_CC]|nr:hypothetical protein AX15_003285 [Amanita polypyramis BW_CC]